LRFLHTGYFTKQGLDLVSRGHLIQYSTLAALARQQGTSA
jgi:hypothetical protein